MAIRYNGFTFDSLGPVSLRITREPDPAPPEKTTRWNVTYTLSLHLYELTSQAQLASVLQAQQALRAPEGLFEVDDTTGTVISTRVTVGADSTAEVIKRGSGELSFSFRAYEPLDTASHGRRTATFTAQSTVFLHHVSNWSHEVREERATDESDAVTRSLSTISFTCRPIYANPQDSEADRVAALTTATEEFLAGLRHARRGRLAYGSFNRTAQLQSATPAISANSEYVEMQLQFTFVVYPSVQHTAASYTETFTDGCGNADDRLVVAGEIRAATRDLAVARLDDIAEHYASRGMRLTSRESTDQWTQPDGQRDPQWSSSLRFQLEWTQPGAVTNAELQVETSQDSESGRTTITYQGRVRARTLLAASTEVRSLAQPATAPDVLLSSSETLEYVTDCDGALEFQGIQFRYQYLASPGDDYRSGRLSITRTTPPLGEHTITLTGHVIAPSESAALATARAFQADPAIANVCVLRDAREESDHTFRQGTRQLERVAFTYTFLAGRGGNTAMRYTRTTTPDFETMVETVAYRGEIFANSQDEARIRLDRFIAALGPAVRIQSRSLTSHFENTSSGQDCHTGQNSFEISYERPLTGDPGFDIIEATFSIRYKGSVPRHILTEVLDTDEFPVVQTNVANTIGRLSITGNVRARVKGTAIAWSHQRRAWGETLSKLTADTGLLAAAGSGYEQAPEEELTPIYPKRGFLDTEIASWRMSFTYTWHYRHLPALMPTV